MIVIKDLSFSYSKNKEVLNNINFKINEGDFVMLIGPNGNGKTTLLKCIDNLLNINKGAIFVNDKDIKDYKRNDLSKLIGYVPQVLEFADMSVFDTILLGRTPFIKFEATDKDYEIVSNLINKFSLQDVALKNVNSLSGGERQKVAIARLLAGETRILLFDEPTSNLDIKNQFEVMNEIKKLSKEEKLTIIVTMHDMNLAIRYGTTFVLLKDGKIAKSGDENIITKETIKDIFDIDVNILDINGQKTIVYRS